MHARTFVVDPEIAAEGKSELDTAVVVDLSTAVAIVVVGSVPDIVYDRT